MPKQLAVGDVVYVPAHRLTAEVQPPFPIVRASILAKAARSVTLLCPYNIGEQTVASSSVHEDVGVLIVRVGDLETETTLLDPLTKTLSHFFKLLLPDDQLRTHFVRTADELYDIYERMSEAYTHIILVGHASEGNLHFALQKQISSTQLVNRFQELSQTPHEFITLCCRSGDAVFAKPFSASPICRNLVAPFGPLHGAAAAQFAEALFAHHFLDGRSFRIAFKQARKTVSGGSIFRIWHRQSFEGRA